MGGGSSHMHPLADPQGEMGMAIRGSWVTPLTVTPKEDMLPWPGRGVRIGNAHLSWCSAISTRDPSVCYLMVPDALKGKRDTLESLFLFRSLP